MPTRDDLQEEAPRLANKKPGDHGSSRRAQLEVRVRGRAHVLSATGVTKFLS